MSRNQLILFIIENLTVFSKTERRFFSWAVCCVEITNECNLLLSYVLYFAFLTFVLLKIARTIEGRLS